MGKDLKDSESRTELVEIEKAYVKGMQEAIDTMEPIRSTKAFMTNAAGATAPLRESFDKCSTGLRTLTPSPSLFETSLTMAALSTPRV